MNEFFRIFFSIFNLNLNFEFGPVWYRPKLQPDRTGLTPVPTGFETLVTSHNTCQLPRPWTSSSASTSAAVTITQSAEPFFVFFPAI